MSKNRKFLRASAIAAALGTALLCGAANAQGYDNDYANDAVRASQNESVIVRPNRHPLGVIQHDPMLGRGRDGSLYSERVSLSEAVDYSDLDLARADDVRQLQMRIHDTAVNICRTLTPEERGAFSQDNTRNCVESAERDAERQIPAG